MKKITYLILTLVVLLSGCKYLDIVPTNDIQTIETIFEKRGGADKWLQDCYGFLWWSMGRFSGSNPASLATDEYVAGEYSRTTGGVLEGSLRIADGDQMSQTPYGGNLWSETEFYLGIRHVNIFLENINNVYNMTDVEKRQWTAEAKSLKALFYFELVRRYGPIVLVPENLPTNIPVNQMQIARSPIDDCFEAIVKLLDESMEDLLPIAEKPYDRINYFCKEGAMALKAKALLYAASPLFNGNESYTGFKNKDGVLLFDQTYDAEKWKRAAEAADEAIAFCEANGRKLVQGNSGRTSPFTNTMLDIAYSSLSQNHTNPEFLFQVRYGNVNNTNTIDYVYYLPRPSNTTDPGSYVPCLGASLKMVETFYTSNGLPIEADKEWNYSGRYTMAKETSTTFENVVQLDKDVLSLHLRREPRFYATIGAHGCYWWQGSSTDHKKIVNCLKNEEFGDGEDRINSSVPQNLSGYWIREMLYPTISLATYFSEIRSFDDDRPIIRLAELYLISAEAWNEYEGPNGANRDKIFQNLDRVRSRAGIPGVEESWLNYSRIPDKIRSTEGMRDIIRQEINIEFMFEGHRFYNIRRWKTAHMEMTQKQYGWNIVGDTETKFFNNGEPVVVWSNHKFSAPRDYFFPIKAEEILISGNVQNPGW